MVKGGIGPTKSRELGKGSRAWYVWRKRPLASARH